jgi:hypothetical protein
MAKSEGFRIFNSLKYLNTLFCSLTALQGIRELYTPLPTGSGKTWPVISLPSILNVLRENFKQIVSKESRVLYIVPLISIYHSLSREMKTLKIPHQILSSGSDSRVDICADIVCVSPEKLLEKSVLNSILKLSWSAVSIGTTSKLKTLSNLDLLNIV